MGKTFVKRSEKIYGYFLKLYPKEYRQVFGEEMQFVFSESLKDAYKENGERGILSLWIRTSIDLLTSIMKQHKEQQKEKKSLKVRLGIWAIVVILLLIIPLVLTIRDGNVEGVGWNWSPFDFVFAFIVLFGSGAAYEYISRKFKNTTYKSAVALGVLSTLMLIWMNGAVGIIGDEDEWPNMLYLGVFLCGFFGTIISRFKPRGMARTLFTMATVQMLIPLIAFLTVAEKVIFDPPGVLGVLAINTFFAALFTISGFLFRKASK